MPDTAHTFVVGQRVRFTEKFLKGTEGLRPGPSYEGELLVEEVRAPGTLQKELGVGHHQLVRVERVSWVSGAHLEPA